MRDIDFEKARANHEWISVGDSLPPIDPETWHSIPVLVFSHRYISKYYVATWSEADSEWFCEGFPIVNVTHWMFLPEVKGGEQ